VTDAIALSFPGVPVAKGRPRALARIVKQGGIARAIVQLITPPATREAEARLQKLAKAYMAADVRPGGRNAPREPLGGPVRMQIVAVYTPPPSWPKAAIAACHSGLVFHTGKPDADNLAKLVGDALNEIAYHDDSQVAELIVRKRYGSRARTDITISPLQSTTATPADKRRASLAIIPAAPASAAEPSPRLL